MARRILFLSSTIPLRLLLLPKFRVSTAVSMSRRIKEPADPTQSSYEKATFHSSSNTHPKIHIECAKSRLHHIQEQVSVAKQQTTTQSHPSNELNV